jgi:protease-4
MLKFVIDGTLKKLGLNMEGVKNGRYADLYSPVRAFSPEERAKIREHMQATYDTFVEKAAAGRNTTPERIDAVAQGRVWTGEQAKAQGLVDELGGLDVAIRLAKRRAKMGEDEDVELVVFPRRRTFYEVLSQELGGSRANVFGLLTAGRRQPLAAAVALPQLFRRGEPLALMPMRFVR